MKMKNYFSYSPYLVIILAIGIWFLLKLFYPLYKVDSFIQALVFGAIFGTLIHQFIVYNTERADKIFFELMGWHRDFKNNLEGKVNVALPFNERSRFVKFQGISLLSNIGNRLTYSIECNNRYGIILNNMNHFLREEYNDHSSSLQELLLIDIRRMYESEIHNHYDIYLSGYFRSLYNTVLAIEKKSITSKRSYSDIIQSYLTQAELHILMYNGLTEYGTKFRKLIEDYTLLENIRIKIIVNNAQQNPLPINQSVALKWLLFKTYYPKNFKKFCQKEWNDCNELDQNLANITNGITEL